MRSKRRMERIERNKRRERVMGAGIWWKILVPLALIISAFIFVKLTTRFWDGSSKETFVFRRAGGDVAVTVLDPGLGEVTTLSIPADTQVEVAGNYGIMRIKNVWQLGLDEKKGGQLLAGTFTKNFLFPVFLWSENGEGIDENSAPGLLKFIFSPKNTNIPLGDRISMAIFSLKVHGTNRVSIDLGKSQFLRKVKLSDGQTGYLLTGPVSSRLTVYFADNNFADKNIRIGIGDATGRTGVAENVGRVLEVMGGKIVSIDQKTVEANTDCEVSGKRPEIVRAIANLLGCRKTSGKSDFDVQLNLGVLFAKRY